MRAADNGYNSRAFGMRMADVVEIAADEGTCEVECMLDEAKAVGIEHLSAKVPTGMKGVANALVSRGFRLADVQDEHRLAVRGSMRPEPSGSALVRPYAEGDLPELVRIAESSFSLDRWHSDPSLPDALCDRYYGLWVESSVAGWARQVLVAEEAGVVAGFLTLREDGEALRVDLTAVDGPRRGRGVYAQMVSNAIRLAAQEGYASLLATTQVDNLGSRVTWARAGFMPLRSAYVLHMTL